MRIIEEEDKKRQLLEKINENKEKVIVRQANEF